MTPRDSDPPCVGLDFTDPPDWRDEVRLLAEHAGTTPVDLARRGLAAGAEAPEAAPQPGDLGAVLRELRALRAKVAGLRAGAAVQLVTVEQAAEVLGVSVSSIRRMMRRGDPPYRRLGRSIRVDLAGLRPLDGQRVAYLAREARNGHG